MYKFTPYQFNGTTLSTNYDAKFLRESDPLCLVTSEAQETEVEGNFPVSPRSQVQSLVLPMFVRLKAVAQSDLNTFKKLFDPDAGDVTLLVTDNTAGSPLTYKLTVRVEDVKAVKGSVDAFIVRLYCTRPIFLNNTPVSDPQTAAATPKTYTETPVGTKRTYPTLTFQPTVLKAHTADYLRRRQVVFVWTSELPGVDSNGLPYPIQINVGGSAMDLSVEAAASRLLANGDDLRVLVNGVEVPRDIDKGNGHDLLYDYVWINQAFKPAVAVTNLVAMGNGVTPGVGDWMTLSNALGTEGLPPAGVLVFDDEAIRYDAITATAVHVTQRGAWGSTAHIQAHGAGTTGWWMEHQIEIIYDFTGAGTPPSTALTSPVMDLALSTNIAHTRPGPQITPLTPLRSGQMLATYTDDNSLAQMLSLYDGGAGIAFRDSAPSAAATRHNNLELYTPCGIEASPGAVTHDITVADLLGLTVSGIDMAGMKTLLATYNSGNDGLAAQITPAAILQRVIYNASIRPITGATTGDVGGITVSATVGRYQQFTLDSDAAVYGLLARFKKTGAPNGGINLALCVDMPGVGSNGTATGVGATSLTDAGKAWAVDQWIGATVAMGSAFAVVTGNSATALAFTSWVPATPAVGAYTISWPQSVPGPQFTETLLVPAAAIGAAYADATVLFSIPGWIELKAGKYWVSAIRSDAAGAGAILWSVTPVLTYSKGIMAGGGYSAPTAAKPAGTFAVDNAVGTKNWANEGNAAASDDVYAVCALTDNTRSYYIKASNFGFAVPAGATILGVVSSVEGHATDTYGRVVGYARLYKAGALTGSEETSRANWYAADSLWAAGGAADMWGTTLSVAEVNAAKFGVGIGVGINWSGWTSTVSVDYITLTIYYQTDTGINSNQTSRFAVLGAPGCVNQAEAPFGSAAEVDIDTLIVTFDAARVPYCSVQAAESIYFWRGSLTNSTTVQTLTSTGIPLPINAIVTVNTLLHTVTRSDTGESIPGLITPSDKTGWMWYVPAVNNLSYAEVGLNPGQIIIGNGFMDAFA